MDREQIKSWKKRWSKSYQKKVKNFRFLTVPNLFWYPFWSSMDVISWPWWFEVKDNPTCRGLWLPAKCGIGHGVFGVKVPLITRHDTSFFKVEDVGWPETLEGLMPVAAWPRLNRRWIKAMKFKLSAVMRIRRILYCSLDSSWYVSSYFHQRFHVLHVFVILLHLYLRLPLPI